MRRPVVRGLLLILVLAVAFIAGQLSADQPQMRSALTNLKQARANLERATTDKGGHRERALRHTNEAIEEVERGLAYDRRH